MISKIAPSDFKKEHDVVGCYIEHAGRFMLLRRHPYQVSGGKWGLPAGKVDSGETIEEAMVREIFEETGLRITAAELSYFDSVHVRNDGHDLLYHMFSLRLESIPDIRINPLEHCGCRWVTPPDTLAMDLVHDQDDCVRLFYNMGSVRS